MGNIHLPAYATRAVISNNIVIFISVKLVMNVIKHHKVNATYTRKKKELDFEAKFNYYKGALEVVTYTRQIYDKINIINNLLTQLRVLR